MSGDGKTIVFEHDFGIWKLDIASRQVKPIPLEIVAETQQTLTEFRDFNSTVDDYDLAPDGKRIVLSVHGELFTAPTDEGRAAPAHRRRRRATCDVQYSPDGKSIAFISDQSGREEIHVIAADGAGPARKVTDLDSLKTSLVLVARQQVDRVRDLRPQALHDRRRRQEPEGAGFLQLRRRSPARPGRRTAS